MGRTGNKGAAYIASLLFTKEVEEDDYNEGTSGPSRMMFEENGSVAASSMDHLKTEISAWLGTYGFKLKDFSYFDEDGENEMLGGRFETDRNEDADGDPTQLTEKNPKGWLARYSLYVLVSKRVPCPKFGLPTI
jgi:hypothetical protein